MIDLNALGIQFNLPIPRKRLWWIEMQFEQPGLDFNTILDQITFKVLVKYRCKQRLKTHAVFGETILLDHCGAEFTIVEGNVTRGFILTDVEIRGRNTQSTRQLLGKEG